VSATGQDSTEPRILHPPGWMPPRGYADGIVASGRVVALAGQIGWDPTTCTFATDDFAAQVAQALRNIVALLREAGAEPWHLVRLTWYVTSREAYQEARREIGRAYRESIGMHYPAMSVVVVAGLLEERAQVEIEATAVVPG
jgi:enamine deaminase RidA (YjgF/YER057c/UK114 family)